MKINTRKQAIDAMCKDCNYDSLDIGTWLAQVESCKMVGCPLYSFRPLTTKTISENNAIKYAAMTDEQKDAYNKKVEIMRERMTKQAILNYGSVKSPSFIMRL